jgi:Hemerythrin HHE cation binding domain
MPTRDQVAAAVRAGRSYEEVGAQFGIPPGQAYLIATGLPADGSDVLGPEFLDRRADLLLDGGSQHLANPGTEVPTEDAGVRAWIKQRVAADEPLRRAAAARTAEPPSIEHEDEGDDTEDVIDILGRDHNQVKYLQEQLETIPGVTKGGSERDQQRRVSILDMMRVRLSKHESAEEQHFWPAVRDTLPDGADLAARAEEQEQHGKDLLQALAGVDGGEEKFDELTEQLGAALRKHVAFEDQVFLAVRDAMPAAQRAEIGRRIMTAEKLGGTRPHPHAPGESTAAALAAAPLDRVRDALGSRPAERKGKAQDEPLPEEDA